MRKIILLVLCLHSFGWILAQNVCFTVRLNKGIELYNQKKYEDATKSFMDATKCPDIPDGGNEILNNWIEKSKNPPRPIYLKVLPAALSFSSEGGNNTLEIESSEKWEINNLPDWCKILEKTRTILKISCDKNDQTIQRVDSLTIAMGNQSKIIRIEQDPTPNRPVGKIDFRTNVHHALVDFGLGKGAQPITSPIEMDAGKYQVKITKEGYFLIDTVVIVPDDGSAKTYDIRMKPIFGVVKLDITATDGLPFQKNYPTMNIGAKQVDLSALYDYSTSTAFNDAEKLNYFVLYKDGFMLLQTGIYDINVTADGFEEYTGQIQIVQGDTFVLKARIKPVSGYLTITDKDGANGAKVFLNNRDIGTTPLFKKEIRTGTYELRFEKEGSLTPEKSYQIEIEKNITKEVDISMATYVKYQFTGNPAGAEIFVNGEKVGFIPSDSILLKEGPDTVVIRKNGFWDYKKIIVADKTNNPTIDVTLEPTYPIEIKSSEEDSLKMVITKSGDTISSGMIIPAKLQLPVGKYKLTLFKNNSKIYPVNFTHSPEQAVIDVPVFSKRTFTTLVADFFASHPKAETGQENEKSLNYYDLMYDFQFGRFNLFPGLSTSILRSSMFSITKDFKKEIIATEPSSEIENTNQDIYPANLFSLSCLFLNGEFRIGGYPTKFLGVCALGSYVWYPPFSKLIQFSHINGQEIFIGVEITSRISYFNANIKIGQEIYKGKYNYLLKITDEKKQFFSNPFTVNNFVITMGITLGKKRSNSNNMLKVW
jgi:hypothetical protein